MVTKFEIISATFFPFFFLRFFMIAFLMLVLILGIVPNTLNPVICSASSTVFTLLSQNSNKNANPIPIAEPNIIAMIRFRALLGLTGELFIFAGSNILTFPTISASAILVSSLFSISILYLLSLTSLSLNS